MRLLFVHNNFPAQFGHLVTALMERGGVEIAAIGSPTARPLGQVRLLRYDLKAPEVANAHPFARRFTVECHRAEQILQAADLLKREGFEPDVTVAHPGWGETLPLKEAFPGTRLITYCEFFYRSDGADVGFDPEFSKPGVDGMVAVHLKNASTLLALAQSDALTSPTEWQKSLYPRQYRPDIQVIHEGVDTQTLVPDPLARVEFASGQHMTNGDEVVTFVARNLEPYRGYHIFMRALPRILAERPRARVVIVGGNGVSYGPRAPGNESWRNIFLDEVRPRLDMSRVFLTGRLDSAQYVTVLRLSSAHVYLTYPFVLSWSMLEAMSVGALVVGSDTAPVREVIEDGVNGLLVPFFDVDALAAKVIGALERPQDYGEIRKAARRTVQERFDRRSICLPRQLKLVLG